MILDEQQTQILLQRKPMQPDTGSQKDLLSGKNVLVTGAGGSIGSELSRIASQHAKSVILAERDEGRLCNIHRELGQTPLLNDLNCPDDIFRILCTHEVDVVLHTAALKHVPLLQHFPAQAYVNNVQLTDNLVKASLASGVSSFTLISTDKSVEPKCVMGQTKMWAEERVREAGGLKAVEVAKQVQAFDRGLGITTVRPATRTILNVVRFGNVLGSSGSVLDIWEEHRLAGKPIPLTTPSMTRYFMSLSEAANLVINSASINKSGTYIADMGNPVDIMDLAIEYLRLFPSVSGIEEVPHREGEKPTEKLHWAHERLVRTEHPNVMRVADGAEVS